MDILVIDQCSKSKEYRDEFLPYDAETIDANTIEDLRERPQTPVIEARKLYSGRQQQYVDDALGKLRENGDTVDRYFISAGFGLVEETDPLPPYNVTFADFSPTEIRERAEELDIQSDILALVTQEYDIIFFALGSDYIKTMALKTVLDAVPQDTWAVCFNQESVTERFSNALSLPARTEEAKAQETIVVALKGRYLQNFADHRSHGKQVSSLGDIETFCTTEYTAQSDLDISDF
ncbi:hypothetical protein [Salinibaculum rarum]|uniref:hypothetical protein n=1 Tax=Salinibaculum rarum TaxID=3058903 RepID=UPI00265DD0B9|nr:hypothetical protein [Salinibaculum sp. KK48]